MPSPPPRKKPPLTDPHRWAWSNGLGIAICAFLLLFLLLLAFRMLMADAKPFVPAIPKAFLFASLGMCLVTSLLWSVVLLGLMARGADLASSRSRNIVLLWSGAGLIFFLIQAAVLLKFGTAPIPNVADWAAGMYWMSAVVGLPAFALMTWVNATLGTSFSYGDHELHFDYDEEDDEEYDEYA